MSNKKREEGKSPKKSTTYESKRSLLRQYLTPRTELEVVFETQ